MSHLTRRSLLGGLAVLPALGALASCGDDKSSGGGGDSIVYGYIPDFDGASLLAIAKDQGLWKKHNLSPTLKTFTNGPLQIQAIGTGDLDFGYIGPGAMWLPASGKASIVTVNGIGNADRVIAQPGITSIEQLKGKKVAVPEGTSGDMILQLALQKAGMSMSDINKVAMDPATVVSAFSSGQVDGAGIWYPMIDNIKKRVPNLVELAQNKDFEKIMQFPNVMVTGVDYPKKNKDVTLRVMKVLREAMDYRAAHLDETIALVSKMTNTDEKVLKESTKHSSYSTTAKLDELTRNGTIVTWLTAMNKFFAANGKIQGTPANPKDYYLGDMFLEAGK